MTTPDPLSDVVEQLRAAVLYQSLCHEAADAITRLTQERAQHSQWVDDTVAQMKLCNRRAQDAEAALAAERERVKALEGENAARKEGLRPFAEAAALIPAGVEDFNAVAYVPAGPHAPAFAAVRELLTAGNFRRARSLTEGGE